MKYIELTQGYKAIVDDEDYEYLMQWKWYAKKSSTGHYYGMRKDKGVKDRKMRPMHREIMKIGTWKETGIEIDHIDHNTLNNQKSNLRKANRGQNTINRPKYKKNGTSTYKGVTKSYNKWMAHCRKEGKRYRKYFKTEVEAALWYNEKVKELHGEFAVLNTIKQ